MKMRIDHRELDKIFKRRGHYEIPDWQREEVWDTKRKQQLIDTILRGWRLPKFYFLKIGDGEYEVVDGQQRLVAIFEFLSDELSLSEATAKEFKGSKYSELPYKTAEAIDDYKIDFDEIEDASDEEIKEFFQRLQVGLPLTASERLNSVHSKLRDFCRKSAAHAFFAKTKMSKRRYAYFDVVAKAAAIEIEGLDTPLRFEELKRIFVANNNFSNQSAVAKRLRDGLAFLEKAVPDPSYLRNRSLVQSIINLACLLVREGAQEGREKVVGAFLAEFSDSLAKQIELGHQATDEELVRFQKTVNANVKSGPKTRHRVLMRRLFEYDPSLLDELDVVQGGFKEEIKSVAEDIVVLVGKINEAHSASKGSDLFKATNKTATAQSAIGKQVTKLAEYKALIENLFFLFWEGPGEKLKGVEPQSFVDVRDLRTHLQHDVDHGKSTGVKAKNKKSGSVFQKYSGAVAPESAAPTRFPLAHAKILKAIRADLIQLAASYA